MSTTAVIETKEAPYPTEMSKSPVEYSFPRTNISVLANLASNREHINIAECVQADLQQLTGRVGGTTLTEVEELFEMADQSFPTIFSWQDESDEELMEGDFYEELSSLIEEEPPQQVYSLPAIPPHLWREPTPRTFASIAPLYPKLPSIKKTSARQREILSAGGIALTEKDVSVGELWIMVDERFQMYRCRPSNLRWSWTYEETYLGAEAQSGPELL